MPALAAGRGRRVARHCGRGGSLAGLAVEEVGKADSLAILAAMPESLKAQAPVRRMLEWHQMKLIAGQVAASISFNPPGIATRFAMMPLSDVAAILDRAQAFAEDMDRLKQRGLYVDMDRSGHIREPYEVTAAEVREQLDRARQATSAAKALLDPTALLRLADSGPAEVEVSRALVSAYAEIRHARSPEAAADVLRNTAAKLRG